ncbi:hypothetical protein PATA110615_23340 [Paenibacillus taichungensis]
MSNVLMIKVNDRPSDQAVSVQIYETFLNTYKKENPTDTIVELDLFEENLPYYSDTAISDLYKFNQGIELKADEQNMVDTISRYMDQLYGSVFNSR